MSDAFYKDGLAFTCTQCSKCCRGESGYVFLSEDDLLRMAGLLSLGRGAFSAIYCRWVPWHGGVRLSLKERISPLGYDCIFWKDGGCSVYEARPLQCSSFPFWHNVMASEEAWNRAAQDCPGMNAGKLHSAAVIEKWLSLQNEDLLIRRK